MVYSGEIQQLPIYCEPKPRSARIGKVKPKVGRDEIKVMVRLRFGVKGGLDSAELL